MSFVVYCARSCDVGNISTDYKIVTGKLNTKAENEEKCIHK